MQKVVDVHAKLKPKIFESFSSYKSTDLSKDLIAGLTVSIVALPLAMAFAIASNVAPINGVYTAIIAGILGFFFTGCKAQISGPSGALVVLSFNVLYQYGYTGLAVTMVLSGLILAFAGLFRLGTFVKFIPYPVTIGYSSAIGFIIVSQQLAYLLGLPIESLPPDFFSKVTVYAEHIHEYSTSTLILSVLAFIAMILGPKVSKKIPPHIFAVGVGIIVAMLFNISTDTIGSRFGVFEVSNIDIYMPEFSLDLVRRHFADALVLALLIAMESLLTALVADGSTTDTHYSNMELISQGMSNIFCGIFGAIPSTGATSRTLTNINAGGVTPLSGLFHSIFLIAFLVFLPRLIESIPLCSLAVVLLFMANGMVNKRGIMTIFLTSKSDLVIFLCTFSLTVVFDLTVGVYIGVTFASLAFMQKVSEHTYISSGADEESLHPLQAEAVLELPAEIRVVQIDGPLCFGVADRFNNAFALSSMGKRIKPKVYILHMKHVSVMDSTGIHVMDTFLARSGERHYKVVISSPTLEVQHFLRRIHAIDIIGEENICSTLDDAIERAYALLEKYNDIEDKHSHDK